MLQMDVAVAVSSKKIRQTWLMIQGVGEGLPFLIGGMKNGM